MAKAPQLLKPATVAKKLAVYLPAMPADLQERDLTRDEFLELQSTPPEWLATLRREGPHPKHEVARKLGISVSGLARAGIDDPLTTAEITALLDDMPDWLAAERRTQAQVREDALAARDKKAGTRGA